MTCVQSYEIDIDTMTSRPVWREVGVAKVKTVIGGVGGMVGRGRGWGTSKCFLRVKKVV